MAIRCSFTLDNETLELIDRYAKEHLIDRNKAILDLIELGLNTLQTTGELPVKKNHSFEEIQTIRKDIESIKTSVNELRSEVRLISHTLDSDWRKEARVVPYQTKKWWMFWRK